MIAVRRTPRVLDVEEVSTTETETTDLPGEVPDKFNLTQDGRLIIVRTASRRHGAEMPI